MKAVILLSGGLDSATCLAIAKSEGFECFTLGFDYGQRHSVELDLAKKLSPNHKIIRIDNFGGSALVDKNIDVPKTTPPPSGGRLGGGLWRDTTNPDLLEKAKKMRKNPTPLEKKLWDSLRNCQVENSKFRRQEPLDNYIVDFVCHEKKLIIEVDGESHATASTYDSKRTNILNNLGYKVLRFNNSDIRNNISGVLQKITEELNNPHPNPLPEGEGARPQIPITYVPARNTIFLSFALAYAEVLQAQDIFIGVNALDYSGYPDCRPEFISAFEKTANLGTKAGNFKIHTPLINLTKAEIITLGSKLGVDYSQTSSCYDPQNGKSCGTCDSCRLRLKGFSEAGLKDPVGYC